jgi:hypothetical protein
VTDWSASVNVILTPDLRGQFPRLISDPCHGYRNSNTDMCARHLSLLPDALFIQTKLSHRELEGRLEKD